VTGNQIRTLLSQNIKQFRVHRELSQADLAEDANISIPFLSEIERGNKWPHPETLAKIADGLNVAVYDLFKPEDATAHDIRTIVTKLTTDITGLVNESLMSLNTIVNTK
jgi:transcriptional regulator with XRE-family HTH domain